MIERDFIAQKTKEYYIKQYVQQKLKGAGISQITLKKIPLGEKIIIQTSRPSLIVGSKGANIKELTRTLKKDFNLENPQIEIAEIKDIFLDASIVAERIASSLERFGSARFKGVGHKTMQSVLDAGALGVEIIISGKIPGARAKNWRFYQGYLKKCGDVALTGVRSAKTFALLKSGIIGIKVSIMPPNLVLPDSVEILDEPEQIMEEIKEAEETEEKKAAKKPAKKSPKKKTAKKTAKKSEEKPAEEKAAVAEAAGESAVETVESTEEPAAEDASKDIEEAEPAAEEPAAVETSEEVVETADKTADEESK
ncbi:30S ribosomal protein S3 [Candidatus Woesearchaeota archaeon CG10_big_fil_rev_8_21_14_0_10_45_16]|nr:MAG: 30S ribosomal protein S3 [Candidatus Woesearchaeota archaeon CG10_big_fil_rev_8_21_14_0_10_45_16]